MWYSIIYTQHVTQLGIVLMACSPKILSQNNNNIVNSSLHNLIFLLIFQKEMEEISFRFPHILELILRYLDNLSLVRCALVNKTWSLIIQNGKQLGIRMIQHYIGPNWKLRMGSGKIISWLSKSSFFLGFITTKRNERLHLNFPIDVETYSQPL